MHTNFKLRIGGKRQITMPEPALDLLKIRVGDFIEFSVACERELRVRGMTLSPVSPLSDDLYRELHRRNEEIEKGNYKEIRDLADLSSEIASKSPKMAEVFRVAITSKRQITVPQAVLDLLNVGVGDHLEFIASGRNEMRVIGMTLTPSDVTEPPRVKKASA